MGLANLFGEELVVISCGECGVDFGLPSRFQQQRRADGQTFYCPNGHPRAYRESDLVKVQRELEQQKKRTEWAQEEAKQQRERANHEEKRARSLKGHATRLRKRIAKGQCPCCSKTFADIEQHIAAEHPRYQREPAE